MKIFVCIFIPIVCTNVWNLDMKPIMAIIQDTSKLGPTFVLDFKRRACSWHSDNVRICMTGKASTSSRAGWVIATVVLLSVAIVAAGSYIIYKYRLRVCGNNVYYITFRVSRFSNDLMLTISQVSRFLNDKLIIYTGLYRHTWILKLEQ